MEGYESRLAINVPLLDKALEIRRRIASILGYKTWWDRILSPFFSNLGTNEIIRADFQTEIKMIKTGKGIEEVSFRMMHFFARFWLLFSQFINDLEAKLLPVGINDREVLLALKKKEHEEKGLPFDGEFYIWDHRYYDRKYIEETLRLDDMLVKEYFPVSTVVPAILEIYQNLLGVQFEVIQNASTWHPGMFISFCITSNLTERIFCHIWRGSSVFCLGERCQRYLWFRWILLPRFVPSR